MLVVDASALIGWVMPDEAGISLDALVETHEVLAAPGLLWPNCGTSSSSANVVGDFLPEPRNKLPAQWTRWGSRWITPLTRRSFLTWRGGMA